MLDVGQANELKLAFRRAGYSNDEIKRLCEGDTLADVRNVLLGLAEIKEMEHIIDCDGDPFVPSGWRVEKHEKSGFFKWDPKAVRLYRSKFQYGSKHIGSDELREEMVGKSVLPANVLDYLIAHPHLIPKAWKKEADGYTTHIFFWGTIYRDPDGHLSVRDLYWDGGKWHWSYNWLSSGLHNNHPAALRVS
jgi:hypothetical protein